MDFIYILAGVGIGAIFIAAHSAIYSPLMRVKELKDLKSVNAEVLRSLGVAKKEASDFEKIIKELKEKNNLLLRERSEDKNCIEVLVTELNTLKKPVNAMSLSTGITRDDIMESLKELGYPTTPYEMGIYNGVVAFGSMLFPNDKFNALDPKDTKDKWYRRDGPRFVRV